MSEIDDAWNDFVRDAPRLEVQLRPWIEQQVHEKIRDLRCDHDFMVAVEIYVIVAHCSYCKYAEYRFYEEPLPLPDVCGKTWKQDYALLGITKHEISATARALRDGSLHLDCRRCGSKIDFDQGDCFYIKRESLSEYFDLNINVGHHVPVAMKKAVLRIFGSRCAACQKTLRPNEATMDHIVAVSKGGLTTVPNLQVLCQPCNAAKADKTVRAVEINLTFPLRPPPTDAFEWVIW